MYKLQINVNYVSIFFSLFCILSQAKHVLNFRKKITFRDLTLNSSNVSIYIYIENLNHYVQYYYC